MSLSSANITHRAEIHSHSTASDGAYSPSKVAELCRDQGVEVWSLTDHDNCFGCGEAQQAARAHDITFIPGIEVSAYHGRSVHILGYGVDPAGSVMKSYADKRVDSRRQRMIAMIERLEDLGVEVSIERVDKVAGRSILGRPHLAEALVAQGSVDNLQDAFDRYLHTGGPAHVALKWPTVPDAVDLIARAGGISVSAHPGQYDLDEAIPQWVDAGLDGLEIIHPEHNRDDQRRYEQLADRYGLLKTASSDFHGNRKRSKYFGSVPFPDAWLDAFLERV